MDEYQIDINSVENGVALVGGRGAPQDVLPRHHRGSGLHSIKGIEKLTSRLEDAVVGISDWATAREAMINELSTIRREIEAGLFP